MPLIGWFVRGWIGGWDNDAWFGDVGVNLREADLAGRVRELCEDLNGPDGAQFLATTLGIPGNMGINFESGEPIPAVVVLRLIHLSGASLHWLVSGEGPKYSEPRSNGK